MVYRANGASYITDYVLQKIYPNKSHKEKNQQNILMILIKL